MSPSLNRIVVYTKKMDEMIEFYLKHFGFEVFQDPQDRIVELRGPDNGTILMLHPAAKSAKTGQAIIKLVFDVEDVRGFCRKCERDGLQFGPVHAADDYEFANAKDPAQNSISVSSRAYRTAK